MHDALIYLFGLYMGALVTLMCLASSGRRDHPKNGATSIKTPERTIQ